MFIDGMHGIVFGGGLLVIGKQSKGNAQRLISCAGPVTGNGPKLKEAGGNNDRNYDQSFLYPYWDICNS